MARTLPTQSLKINGHPLSKKGESFPTFKRIESWLTTRSNIEHTVSVCSETMTWKVLDSSKNVIKQGTISKE